MLESLIVSCNVRLHDGTEGRYRWLISSTKKNPNGATSHLDRELPLGIYELDTFTVDSIWLSEGTTIKPSIARYKLGVPVVGAKSLQELSSKRSPNFFEQPRFLFSCSCTGGA